MPQLSGTLFFGDFSCGSGPIFAVHVGELVEREDLSNLVSLDGGRIAPYREILIVEDGVHRTFRTVLRVASGNLNLCRTDLRFGEGENGEIYLLNKHDGWVRKIAAVPGHPGPPQVVPMLPAPAPLLLLLALAGVAESARSRRSARSR